MARLARGEYIDPQTVQIVHTVQRCVRRAFLCGKDASSGKDYEYRKQWIRDRLEFLASVFGIDCLTYTVMSNHIHLILRSRPDVVRTWSDEEVARRWLRLFPKRRTSDGQPAQPADTELNQILLDPSRVARLRTRLSDISWWMKCTAENIARRANREDEVTGHFWEGRYKAQPLLDEASLLACTMYIDLNPVRAALAETPEESEFTGARDRIDDLLSPGAKVGTKTAARSRQWERRARQRRRSGWMSPLQIDEKHDPVGPAACQSGRRASIKGFLSLTLEKYLEILDWTGRQLKQSKSGSIPKDLASVLERLGIRRGRWHDLVSRFGNLFRRVAGNTASVTQESKRRNLGWMHTPGADCFH